MAVASFGIHVLTVLWF